MSFAKESELSANVTGISAQIKTLTFGADRLGSAVLLSLDKCQRKCYQKNKISQILTKIPLKNQNLSFKCRGL